MQTTTNTVLITGGATGIGLALAQALHGLGNTVIICGRRADKLHAAQALLPGLHTRTCDVADAGQRAALAAWVTAAFPALNILVNNAGIQRELDFASTDGTLDASPEIDTNFAAPVHLTALLLPHLRRQAAAAVINVTSGLGFVPLAAVPVYCATKAALHSFSVSLRHQLRATAVRVFEVIPPIVETDLDQGARARRGQKTDGLAPEAVAAATLDALRHDRYEAPVGKARLLRLGARLAPARFLELLNRAAGGD